MDSIRKTAEETLITAYKLSVENGRAPVDRVFQDVNRDGKAAVLLVALYLNQRNWLQVHMNDEDKPLAVEITADGIDHAEKLLGIGQNKQSATGR